ncbi:stalk domain-containing protein [Parageobacillus thermoglucosidasius]|uniref:stalk domain-containing protein n=1 Tax=Parageobacillus thermoglucosidasius TaxID=1426 RepID=UPI000B576C02|nr:stalk domain-containing protein [Parageobacillus thermoglucosidasius]OUM93145.1 MAG: hypothetical protein BAA00_02920 [Parageobacillus thermoglucosidasius]
MGMKIAGIKKIKAFFMIALLSTILTTPVGFGFSESPTILANHDQVQYPTVHVKVKGACGDDVCGHGYNINGISYVPVRMVMESLGAEVVWDHQTQTIQIIKKSDSEESDAAGIFREKTEELLREADKQTELLKLLDEQLQIALEIYQETGDVQWIAANQSLVAERKKTVDQLAEKILKHVEQYQDQVNDIKPFFELADNLKKLINQYEFAEKALENYSMKGQAAEFRNYLLYRRYALVLFEKDLSLKDEIVSETMKGPFPSKT